MREGERNSRSPCRLCLGMFFFGLFITHLTNSITHFAFSTQEHQKKSKAPPKVLSYLEEKELLIRRLTKETRHQCSPSEEIPIAVRESFPLCHFDAMIVHTEADVKQKTVAASTLYTIYAHLWTTT